MTGFKNILLAAGFSISFFSETDRETAFNILQDESPESYFLLTQYFNATTQSGTGKFKYSEASQLDKYLDYSNTLTLLNSLPVAVHEICHGYTNFNVSEYLESNKPAADPNGHYDLIYLDPGYSVLIKKSKVFRTSLIDQDIGDSLKSFRYETYVFPSSEIGAQVDGAYGLLDEWNAYHHDMRTSMDLYNSYRKMEVDEKFAVMEFLKITHSTYIAYQEFKFYILRYLIHARKKDPEVFYEIVSNNAFREAFTEIDQRFSTINLEFFELKDQITEDFLEKNVPVAEDDRFFYLGRSGIGNFLNYYQRLEAEMKMPAYQDLLKLLHFEK